MPQRPITSLIPLALVAVCTGPALAEQTQPSGVPIYGPWWDGYGWQFWWICPLMMMLMMLVVAPIFIFGRRHAGDSVHHWVPPWRDSSESAVQILSERFARGEIDRDEYEQRRAAISSRD